MGVKMIYTGGSSSVWIPELGLWAARAKKVPRRDASGKVLRKPDGKKDLELREFPVEIPLEMAAEFYFARPHQWKLEKEADAKKLTCPKHLARGVCSITHPELDRRPAEKKASKPAPAPAPVAPASPVAEG